jgi:hypothetical protein
MAGMPAGTSAAPEVLAAGRAEVFFDLIFGYFLSRKSD